MSDNQMNNKEQARQQPSRPPVRIGGGGHHALRPGEKARDFKGTLRRLIDYLGKYNLLILGVLVIAAASTVFSILGPKILGRATTQLFEDMVAMVTGTGSGVDFVSIGAILIQVLTLYVISAFLAFLQGFIMSGVAVDITYRFRQDISQKINKLPLQYFDKVSQGEVLSRVTNDVDTVSQTLNQSLSQIITSITSVVGILVMMLTISWQMTMVALLTIPITMVAITLIVRTSQKYFVQQQNYLGHVNGHVEEMFGGHVVIKAFNAEEESVKTFSGLNETLYTSAWKSQFLSQAIMPIMRLISNLGYVVVSILGGYYAIQGTVTIGDIQAFIQYVRQFNNPLMQIANISNVLQQTAAAAERVFEFLNESEEIAETERPVVLDHVEGAVEFRNVRFGYDPDTTVIKDLSFSAQPGQKIAIVGPTGAGKTTLVKLLMRFYDVDDGEILVDGHNIRDFKRKTCARCLPWCFRIPGFTTAQFVKIFVMDMKMQRTKRLLGQLRRRTRNHYPHLTRWLPDGAERRGDEYILRAEAVADDCPPC